MAEPRRIVLGVTGSIAAHRAIDLASLLTGFYVSGFGAALWGSLIYSVFGVVIDLALQRLFSQR
jgi:uncharacterized membrane protein YvlD (DUF360 family)